MSWVSRMVEQRLASAAEAGELDGGPLKGKPLPGIDEQRRDGWWADQMVKRELSHDRRKVGLEAAAKARVEFWKVPTVDEVRALVIGANDEIARANINLTEADQIAQFDSGDICQRWKKLRAN